MMIVTMMILIMLVHMIVVTNMLAVVGIKIIIRLSDNSDDSNRLSCALMLSLILI